jgi:Tol biopolymer transport system component
MSAIIREDPKPIGQVQSRVPLPLRWIVDRCLAKDPEERYASTRDLARDLSGARDHISEATSGAEALLAGPTRRRGRLVPLSVGAGILALGLLAGWAAQGLWRDPPPSAPSFRRLTFRRGQIGNARFAPDGRTIVYGASWEGEPAQRMYLTHPESPESRPFDFGNADILSISPSGELAIVLDLESKPTLARVPLAGGVPRQVLEGVGYANADWAPDGKELAVVRSVEGRERLEFPIGQVLFEGSISSPRISPGGNRIAFFEQTGSGSIAVIDTSGKGKRTLSSGLSGLAGVPCWTQDGEEIWFTAAEVGKPAALYALSQSGKRRLVMRVPGSLELDDMSADGRVLVANHAIQRSLTGLAPGESKERDLTWLDASLPSDLSPDGRMLVITEMGEGGGPAASVYLRKTDGSPAVRLGEGAGLALSPDQKWVLTLVVPASSAPHLALLPTGAGESRTFKNDRFESFGEADWVWGPSWGADWLPDGKRIIFTGAERGHRRRIYVQDLAGGPPRPVSPEGVGIRRSTGALSPDGRFVVGVQGLGNAAIYPVDGGEVRPIKGLVSQDEPVQWSADNRSLFVYSITEFPRKVWLLDPSTGARKLWKEFRSHELVKTPFQPLITPDGNAYVYGSVRALSELYLVEGLK